MVGFRGCGRYIDPFFEECFLQSLELMIPFVHTWDMAKDANELLEPNGLKRGEDSLKVNMMTALRSCVFVAEEYLHYFDCFCFGRYELAKQTLGLEPRAPEQMEAMSAMCLGTRFIVAPT